jgi:hypothetical protein
MGRFLVQGVIPGCLQGSLVSEVNSESEQATGPESVNHTTPAARRIATRTRTRTTFCYRLTNELRF